MRSACTRASGVEGAGINGAETYAAYKPPQPQGTFPPKTETAGAVGQASDGNGVVGITTYPYLNADQPSGVLGMDTATAPTANDGVFGTTTNGNAGVYGFGKGTPASNSYVGGSDGVIGVGFSGVSGVVTATPPPTSSGLPANGAIVGAIPYGASTTSLYYAFTALGAKQQRVFSVDGNGNVQYTGKLTTVAGIGDGSVSERSVPTVARPILEDVGQGALRGGKAFVRLDPAFTASIETRAPYLVFVTPDGESNQLYVSNKTSLGFDVRETRGASSVAFDYRIVAYPKGELRRTLVVRPDDASPAATAFARAARLPAGISSHADPAAASR